jgi:hypothetical protein
MHPGGSQVCRRDARDPENWRGAVLTVALTSGVDTMITVMQCAALADLASSEIFLGATPSAKHHSLLLSYLLNLERGPVAVRDIIVADLRSFIDLGASSRAADLLIVLRLFLSEYSHAGRARTRSERQLVASIPLPPKAHQNQIVFSRSARVTVLSKAMPREMPFCGNTTRPVHWPRDEDDPQ